MSEIRVRVDFNRQNGDGFVLASTRGLGNETVTQGDRVLVFQPGENMEHYAHVVSVDADSKKISLDVDWASDPAADLAAPYNETLRTYLARAIFGEAPAIKASKVSTSPAFASGRRDPILTMVRVN